MTRYYAGVGSRDTPRDICELMTEIARKLHAAGFVLRSGGADGADRAFQDGASVASSRIYVPWRGFGGVPDREVILAPSLSSWDNALIVAEEAHPAWDKCSQGARKLLTRNVYQILGDDLMTPVEFVIGWTRGGRGSGGTGQAYRIAQLLDNPPPIYDLGHADVEEKFRRGWLPV